MGCRHSGAIRFLLNISPPRSTAHDLRRSNSKSMTMLPRQRLLFIWSIWSISSVWLNDTNQMNQINQINKTNQIKHTDQMDQTESYGMIMWNPLPSSRTDSRSCPACRKELPRPLARSE